MVYLLGVSLPDKKPAHIALQSVFGVGPANAERICNALYIHKHCRLGDLSENKLTKVAGLLSKMTIEAELRREVKGNVERLVRIGTYRGARHAAHLPLTGRTQTNGQTAKRLNGRGLRKFSTATSLPLQGVAGVSQPMAAAAAQTFQRLMPLFRHLL